MMPRPMPRPSLALTLVLCLLLPAGVVAQSDGSGEAASPGPEPSAATSTDVDARPALDGLARYRSIDLSGSQIEATRNEDEVAQWGRLAEGAGASLDELRYTYDAAFDPSRLPEVGGLATVRVAGATEEALRAAVVQDIVDQVVGLGSEAPATEESAIGGKDVTVVRLPQDVGFPGATVYAIPPGSSSCLTSSSRRSLSSFPSARTRA